VLAINALLAIQCGASVILSVIAVAVDAVLYPDGGVLNA
jgi:hypothetical protein